jgi:predicted PhzF superfamily epimerase YddE/YHI9
LRIARLNAFTGPRALGNPAGVALLDSPLPAEQMQAVAKIVGYSETAFVWPEADGYRLRWFTPAVEVPLCGHATLASAFALTRAGRAASEVFRFHTLSGLLTARTAGEWIELDFPSSPPKDVPIPREIEAALGAKAKCAAKSIKWVLELSDAEAVQRLRPDHDALKKVETSNSVGVTARGRPPYDYVCRNFAHYAGIPEDPATGSLQCVLAPYWAARLGKTEFLCYQASERGGVLRVLLDGDRVRIAGQVSEDEPLEIDLSKLQNS